METTKPELQHVVCQVQWSADVSWLWFCFRRCRVFSNALHFNDTWLFWGRVVLKLLSKGVAFSLFLFFLFCSTAAGSIHVEENVGSSAFELRNENNQSVQLSVCSCALTHRGIYLSCCDGVHVWCVLHLQTECCVFLHTCIFTLRVSLWDVRQRIPVSEAVA